MTKNGIDCKLLQSMPVSEEIASFSRVALDFEAMTRQLDANLYRNRTN
jgi:hypothetical protein